MYNLIYLFRLYLYYLFTYLFIHLLLHLFIYLFICLLIYSFNFSIFSYELAVEHPWQEYLKTHGPSHLRRASRGLRLLTGQVPLTSRVILS